MSVLDTLLADGLTGFGKIMVRTKPPLVHACHIRQAMVNACSGMIILRKYNCYLDSFFIPGEYTHSGIVENSTSVIHAVAEGVGRIDLIDFIKDSDGFALLCPKALSTISVINYARSQIGMPYDFKFEVEACKVSAFFCHELTARSLAAGGLTIIPELKTVGPVTHEIYTADMFLKNPNIVQTYVADCGTN